MIWPIGEPNDDVTSNQALEPKDLAFLDSERALSICARDICVFAYYVYDFRLVMEYVFWFWFFKL